MNYVDLTTHLSMDEHVYITGHIHPDGDCIGAALAMYHLLDHTGYRVSVVLENRPRGYEFLKGYADIITQEEYQQNKESLLNAPYQLIVVDSGDLSRIEPFLELFNKATCTFNIDHHSSNTHFGDYQHVDVDASSTCEVIGMMLNLEKNGTIQDLNVATALYTGIIYDTGLFKHDCTRKETHLIAAKLVDGGVNQTFLINKLYFTKTLKSLKALEIALSNIQAIQQGHIVLTYISYEQMCEHALEKSDTESIVNQLIEVDTAKVSCFILGLDYNKYKISFRSNSSINVCEIAQKYQGGGHVKAAGCSIDGQLNDIVKLFTRELVDAYERNS